MILNINTATHQLQALQVSQNYNWIRQATTDSPKPCYKSFSTHRFQVEICLNTTDDMQEWNPYEFQVDGVTVKLPYSGSCYTVDYVGDAVRVQTTFNLAVTFNGNNLVEVMLDGSSYSGYGKLRGMCGGNTGSSSDDYYTSSGSYVSQGLSRGTTIGDSYVVSDPETGTRFVMSITRKRYSARKWRQNLGDFFHKKVFFAHRRTWNFGR